METIVAGPGGTVNAVRSEIGGVVLDKVAGGEIEAVFTAVTHKGANLLQRKNPELTYDEAAALAALGTIATISAGSSLASKIGPILKKWDFKHVKKPADIKIHEVQPHLGETIVESTAEGQFQTHHIISHTNENTKNSKLFEAAGMSYDETINKIKLPTKAEYDPTKSVHGGRHLDVVSEKLGRKMNDAYERGQVEGWTQQQYRAELESIINEERAALESGARALNKNQRPWAEVQKKD
ncbi:hypothetical protein MIDIC_240067 [Alphaproteobacteria bacterium]